MFEGQLDLDRGLYDDAADQFEQALREAPGYHIALAGLAKAGAAQGRTEDAIELYQQAIAVVPQPDYLANLGDLYHLSGQDAQAQTQYGTVEVIATLAAINQQVYNRQLAMYYADHDLKVDEALRLTTAELTVRKDVYGYDAQAWALYKNGRLQEAKAASQQALTQHTPDAKIWYHAGLIDQALGHVDAARTELRRALTISPDFDPLQAPKAHAALTTLGVHGTMKRLLLAAAVAAGVVVALAGTASAHPLGNFTINQFSGLHVGRDRHRRSTWSRTWPRSPPTRSRATSTPTATARSTTQELATWRGAQCAAQADQLKVEVDGRAVRPVVDGTSPSASRRARAGSPRCGSSARSGPASPPEQASTRSSTRIATSRAASAGARSSPWARGPPSAPATSTTWTSRTA